MLLVDVEVPSLSRTYHFNLNETVSVEILIAEMTAAIEQKEQCKLMGLRQNLMLCAKESRRVLFKDRSLNKQGIKNADSLILI